MQSNCPILRGRDIKRYGYEFADLWLITTHNGSKEKGIPPVKIDDYPAIKKHLDSFSIELEKRSDKGDTPYNLRNCAYMEDFYKPKIMYPNMTKYLPFLYDEEGFMLNDKGFIITGQNLAFLISFLNSSLFKYCYKDNFPELLGETRELRKIFFDKISVKTVDTATDSKFKNILLEIQEKKRDKQDTIDLEKHLDEMIFDIHELSEYQKKTIGFISI